MVTGAAGMLGHAILDWVKTHSPQTDLIALTRNEADLRSPTAVDAVARACGEPGSVVINAAAYTDVNKAEAEEDLATQINGHGAGFVAAGAAKAGARMLHVSTDYVFDGTKAAPYSEDDVVCPINAYGRSKLVGEQAVLAAHPGAAICRTQWLYGLHGRCFPKTILTAARAGKSLRVVADQVGAPTYTRDLAAALMQLAATQVAATTRGIFHVVNSGYASWYDLTLELLRSAQIDTEVTPVNSTEFPTPAIRPANSRLSIERWLSAGLTPLPSWQEGVHRYVAEEQA